MLILGPSLDMDGAMGVFRELFLPGNYNSLLEGFDANTGIWIVNGQRAKTETHMMDSVFLIESIRETHRTAPLFAEREKYLRYLLEIGIRRERVRNVATMLLHCAIAQDRLYLGPLG